MLVSRVNHIINANINYMKHRTVINNNKAVMMQKFFVIAIEVFLCKNRHPCEITKFNSSSSFVKVKYHS